MTASRFAKCKVIRFGKNIFLTKVQSEKKSKERRKKNEGSKNVIDAKQSFQNIRRFYLHIAYFFK